MVMNQSQMAINHSRIQRLRRNTLTMSLKSNITRREISEMWHNLLEILLIAAWKIYWLAWFSGSSKPWALAAPDVKAAAKTTPVPNPISKTFLPYGSTSLKIFCKLYAVKLPWNPRVFPWAPSETLLKMRTTLLVFWRPIIFEPMNTFQYQLNNSGWSSNEIKSKL